MKRIILAVIIGLCLFGVGCFSAVGESSTEKALTVMVYMIGSELESEFGAASNDIDDILQLGVDTRQVNVVLMTGGSTRWRNGQSEDTTVISKMRGTHMVVAQSMPSMNMGEAETLRYFLDFAFQHLPAQSYSLILWGHGYPTTGFGFDELYAGDVLTMDEFAEAMEASPFCGGNKLSWIAFDSTFMSNIETALTFAPYAGYMIASEYSETINGLSYRFLNTPIENLVGKAAGRAIIDCYMEDCGDELKKPSSMACVDLNFAEAVSQAKNNLFSTLKAANVSAERIDQMYSKAYGKDMFIGEYGVYDFALLSNLCADFAPEAVANLEKTLDRAVIYTRGNMENGIGLSLCLPFDL